MMGVDPTRGYLNIKEAAEYLNISVRTIRRYLDRIRHYRCDFGIRFRKEDLDAYMTSFRKEPIRPKRVDLDEILHRVGLGQPKRPRST